jgi:hypothetical protein
VADPPEPVDPALAPPPSSFVSSLEEQEAPSMTTTLPTNTVAPLRRIERRLTTGGVVGDSVSAG